MSTLKEIENEIEKIKARNRKVEADKAWETSGTRTIFISLVTFFLLYIFFRLTKSEASFLNALVSTAVYWLSTFSYSALKSWWLKKRRVE